MFSAKCSMLQEHNIKIDWSWGDLELKQMVCAGSTVHMCNFCSPTLHKLSMCSNSRGYQNSKIQAPYQDKYGSDIVVHDGMQICNNFNQQKGCVKHFCRYAHINTFHQSAPESESSNSLSKPGRDYLDLAVENLKAFAVADSTKALYNMGYEHYLNRIKKSEFHIRFQNPTVSIDIPIKAIILSLRY
ncbi:unnamed protein product [Mytilus coruscus]|uniref:C3H1-type domain-containing protein n=1 Tax=Mytilus coruscus TaxID=42192 RepID=A0A6J8DD79_MYTCO|nr:unnamed protein product [Mytilus coruscus]